MESWYRVFGALETLPEPAGIAACLGSAISLHWSADDHGWFAAELVVGEAGPVHVERWLSEEEGIRAELNSWAGFLETCDFSPHFGSLMERTIQSRQLFTIHRPIDPAHEGLLDRLCLRLCQHLATMTAGFYQADGMGFFDADGTVLVEEQSPSDGDES